MSKAALIEALGARTAVKLSRRCGGAGIYVPAAKPNYAEFTEAERQRIYTLHLHGYFNREIAAITGRSVSSIGPILFCARLDRKIPRLPKVQSSEGKIVRAALRRGESVTVYGRTYHPPQHIPA